MVCAIKGWDTLHIVHTARLLHHPGCPCFTLSPYRTRQWPLQAAKRLEPSSSWPPNNNISPLNGVCLHASTP